MWYISQVASPHTSEAGRFGRLRGSPALRAVCVNYTPKGEGVGGRLYPLTCQPPAQAHTPNEGPGYPDLLGFGALPAKQCKIVPAILPFADWLGSVLHGSLYY
jgi:hypothetical protein